MPDSEFQDSLQSYPHFWTIFESGFRNFRNSSNCLIDLMKNKSGQSEGFKPQTFLVVCYSATSLQIKFINYLLFDDNLPFHIDQITCLILTNINLYIIYFAKCTSKFMLVHIHIHTKHDHLVAIRFYFNYLSFKIIFKLHILYMTAAVYIF